MDENEFPNSFSLCSKTRNLEENEFAFEGEENEFCSRRMSIKLINFEQHHGFSFPVSLTKRCKKLGEKASHF